MEPTHVCKLRPAVNPSSHAQPSKPSHGVRGYAEYLLGLACAPSGYATATLAPSKGRLMRCTVDGLTPNRSAMTRMPGRPGVARASRDSFFQRRGYRRPTKTLPLALLARFALGRLRTPAYRMCDGVAGFVPPAYAGTSRLLTDFARCPGVAC
jgi:hypothetical protein